jgi:hypothetical protein
MEFTEENEATLDGTYHAAIYMLRFPFGYLQMEPEEEMGLVGWSQDSDQELLPWMEWASVKHIVTVLFITICAHFVIICGYFIKQYAANLVMLTVQYSVQRGGGVEGHHRMEGREGNT